MKIFLPAVICLSILAAAHGKTCGGWDRCGGVIDENGTAFTECSGCEKGYVCFVDNAEWATCRLPTQLPPMPPGSKLLMPPPTSVVPLPPCVNGTTGNGTACEDPTKNPSAPRGSVGTTPGRSPAPANGAVAQDLSGMLAFAVAVMLLALLVL